jgi:leucyl/phenylalanyl-tRNA---protein transferase
VPVFRLDKRLAFPPVHLADPNGMLAVGGDLSPERLLLAYSSGIFPWYSEELPILWYSPDPRYVLPVDALHVPRSLAKVLRRGVFDVRFDTRFPDVIEACAREPRPGQDGTWITREMIDAYVHLHELGFAHSIEAFLEGELVGGLYGVSLGSLFFGESMFANAPDASKVAFVTFVERARALEVDLVDCQVHTQHLERFGATDWPRVRYLEALARGLERPTRRGSWTALAKPIEIP